MPISPEVIHSLRSIVGAENVLTQQEDVIPYSFDGTAALRHPASCVVFPDNAGDVGRILKLARHYHLPVVPRGSGTGLSGGSVPVPDSMVLCLVKMDHVRQLDKANLTIRAESGVLTQKIADLASAAGLLYPPDPGSMKISTIGGNIAENSGGLCGLKYGVTRDYVMGLEVVLADGNLVWLGSKCVRDVAGYSIKDIFLGSEGTLGIITEVLLKLLPRPAAKKTMLATFNRMDAAASAVSTIIAARIVPRTFEFLDKVTTYDATKLERNSPRGRISLMRAIADEELELTRTFGMEMYYCLGCLACMSACPARVNYARMF